MSKLTDRAETTRENIKQTLQNLKRSASRKGCYSITAKWDDRKTDESKVAIRDPRIDSFDEMWVRALSIDPDYLVVKIFENELANAIEIQDGENTIRLKAQKAPKPGRKSLKGFESQQNPEPKQPDEITAMKIEHIRFIADMDKRELQQNHNQQLREKDNRIEDLTKELSTLKEDKKLKDDYIQELEDDKAEKEEKGIANIQTIVKGGLLGFAEFARTNPEGKLLGMIPNRTLAGLLGASDTAQIESPDTNPRTQYWTQITQICMQLNDEDFQKLYAVFAYMAADRANINELFNLIQTSVKTSR